MSDNTLILFAHVPVSSAMAADFAASHDLPKVYKRPWTSTFVDSLWGNEDRSLGFSAHAESGVGVFVLAGDNASLATALRDRFELLDAAEVIESARSGDDPIEALRGVYALSSLLDSAAGHHDEAFAILAERLCDKRHLVRWATARVLGIRTDERAVAAFEHAAARFDDLAGELQQVREQFDAANDGTLYDTYTDSWHELIARARQGIADEQYRRTEKAAEMLLDDAVYHTEGLLLRGLAYEAAGEPALALALVGASLEEQRIDDSNERNTPELRAETVETLERLDDAVGIIEPDERFDHEVARWNAKFADAYHRAAGAGMAAALRAHVPAREALFSFIAGRYHGDVALLERAVELASDSAACLAALAQHLPDDRADEALKLYELALEQCDADPSGIAALIKAHAAQPDPITRAEILEGVARSYYDAADWDEAATWADRLVDEDPRSTTGWQMRANARTFALRHEEAITAYEDAIGELSTLMDDPDSFYFGEDPLPGMHFNHSCVLAKLGRRDEALDALRRAVRADEVWAERAAGDDYWEAFWDDDAFQAIAQGGDDLVTAEEEERPFIEDLVVMALGSSYNGQIDEAIEHAERATQLASRAGFRDLEVRARTIHSRTLAFHEDPLLGLELMQQTFDLAIEHGADIGAELLADTTHDYAVVLHAAEKFEEATSAYARGLDARTEAYGADHPILAKSLGDMARLQLSVGDEDAGVELLDRGLALLDAYFDSDPQEDEDTHDDALVDRASLLLKRANLALLHDDEAAIEYLARTIAALEALMAERYTAWNVYDQTYQLVENVIGQPASDDELIAAQALRLRLDDLELSPDPATRAEQVFWRDLRGFCKRMLAQGVTGEMLADTFARALRGEELPDLLRQSPEIGGLSKAFAQRANRFPTFIVSAALALSMAEENGDIDQALADLEGICVAATQAEV